MKGCVMNVDDDMLEMTKRRWTNDGQMPFVASREKPVTEGRLVKVLPIPMVMLTILGSPTGELPVKRRRLETFRR